MRKRMIVEIIVFAICLIFMLAFGYFFGMLIGPNLQFNYYNGIFHINSSTGNAEVPLLSFILILLIPIGLIVSLVLMLWELRYRSKKKKNAQAHAKDYSV